MIEDNFDDKIKINKHKIPQGRYINNIKNSGVIDLITSMYSNYMNITDDFGIVSILKMLIFYSFITISIIMIWARFTDFSMFHDTFTIIGACAVYSIIMLFFVMNSFDNFNQVLYIKSFSFFGTIGFITILISIYGSIVGDKVIKTIEIKSNLIDRIQLRKDKEHKSIWLTYNNYDYLFGLSDDDYIILKLIKEKSKKKHSKFLDRYKNYENLKILKIDLLLKTHYFKLFNEKIAIMSEYDCNIYVTNGKKIIKIISR